MTAIETAVEKIESIDFRTLDLRIGGPVIIQGREEIVTKFTVTEAYDSRKLERFGTVRREGDVVIIESGYSVNGSNGREHLDYSGTLTHSSERYSELNKILNEFAK